MSNHLIDKQDPRLANLLRRMEKVSKMLDKQGVPQPYTLDGQRYLTDRELSELLKVSRRTLQEYRSLGYISYYLVCGKVLYKECEIQQFLENARKKSLDELELL